MEKNPDQAPVDRRVRALAFAGGGFDTATQLGITHALLVSRGVAPEYVAGISAGAINAAALAEVLQAGQDLPADARQDAQVDNLRRFLASFTELPGELLRSILPDTFEINATKPLRPIDLPILFDRERAGRDVANNARAGLIRLINRLFEVRLPVRALSLFINRMLHFLAATEDPSWKRRFWTRFWTLGSIWCTGIRYAAGLGPIAGAVVHAAWRGAPRPSREDQDGEERKERRKGTAAVLIGGWRTIRQSWRGFQDLLSTLFFLFVWMILPPFAALYVAWTYLRPATLKRSRFWRELGDRILRYYGIADSLGYSHVLREQLIRCFDPTYYGETDIAQVLERALARSTREAKARKPDKTLAAYRGREPRIVVAPIAADLASGELRVLPSDVAVVDALLAATAIVPVFPAVKVESRHFRPDGVSERIFIDGLNISNEPIGALVGLLRGDDIPHPALEKAAIVDVYTISGRTVADGGECSKLLEVALRALQLRRLRDADIEQRYSDLYTRALPAQPAQARVTIDEKTYVRAKVWSIALDRPAGINREALAGSSGAGLRELVYEAVADGCRATLETFIPRAIAAAGNDDGKPVPCWNAVRERLGKDYPGLLRNAKEAGPGLPEICAHCTLNRRPDAGAPPAATQSLLPRSGPRGPEWPLAGMDGRPQPAGSWLGRLAEQIARPFTPPEPARDPLKIEDWPRDREGRNGSERPLVSLLFGGGVFRGVFHMGVMNGLNELGLLPDLVAGSSVGSIVAAMIAQVFTVPRERRQGPIADLSATFLSLDQLVMTDRLADFVRGLTLRASDAVFSTRDLDLVLRRYDLDRGGIFDARARRVIAGLERLFYLSPSQLLALARAAREQDFHGLSRLLQEAIQEFLDRGGVGQEILGAEPLALLIQQEVIRSLLPGASDGTFHDFGRHGIQFLATATNLHQGKLETLGMPQEGEPQEQTWAQAQTSLLYALLASSAFPAVFRPRKRWEILRRDQGSDQFVDGGIIDNLPLDAVAKFLDRASQGKRPAVARRPRGAGGGEVPHLLFTASLELEKTALGDGDAEEVRQNFLRLRKRAKTFGYNRKIDAYATLQRDLREIYQHRVRHGETGGWEPLDLHVIAVRPRWLCRTFGFHPMLGFRRRMQAESIAHGCASTIATFHHDAKQNGSRTWMEAWGAHGLGAVDDKAVTSHFDASQPALNPRRHGKERGLCWFRDAPCPFSRESLLANADLKERTALLAELPRIYEACGRPETHRPPHAVQNALE